MKLWDRVAAAAKSSVVSDSVRSHGLQPTRLLRPWDSPGKNTGVGYHFLLQYMKVKSENEVTQSRPTPVTPRTAAHQAPPSMGFSRQKYWSGVPLPFPEEVYTDMQIENIRHGWDCEFTKSGKQWM